MFIVVTPARNEADQVEGLVECMRASTFQPDCWFVVDDGSTDGTGELFKTTGADLPFLKVHRIEDRTEYMGFHYSEVLQIGLKALGNIVYRADYVGILDADIRVGKNYWKVLSDQLISDEKLVIDSGVLCTRDSSKNLVMNKYQRIDIPFGGLTLIKGDFLREIGGIPFTRSPDSIMIATAKMSGLKTKLLTNVFAESTRSTDYKSEYIRVGKSRGQRAWHLHQPFWQVLIRGFAYLFSDGLGYSKNYVGGYVSEWSKGGEKYPDDDVRRYYRIERSKEWGRSLMYMMLRREDPHRVLSTRVVNRDEIYC